MIGLIIFSIICFCIIWFVVFKVILIYQKKSLTKNVADKISKQDRRIFNDGKEVNFKELLGREEEKKEEVVEEVNEEPTEIIEDIKPEVEQVNQKMKGQAKPTVKTPFPKEITFNDEFKLPEREE